VMPGAGISPEARMDTIGRGGRFDSARLTRAPGGRRLNPPPPSLPPKAHPCARGQAAESASAFASAEGSPVRPGAGEAQSNIAYAFGRFSHAIQGWRGIVWGAEKTCRRRERRGVS